MPEMEALGALKRVLAHPASTGEELQRRLFTGLLISVAVPVGLCFAWFDFTRGESGVGWSVVGVVAAFVGALWVNRNAADMVAGYRVVATVVLPLMGVVLYLGGGDGFAFLWMYFIPPAAFYVFGSREGLVWYAFALGESAILLLGEIGASYPRAAGIRFLVTYSIAGALALALQRSRERLFARLVEEKEELQQALQEVRTLSEMIPMCAWCRNVRDDEGFWSRIEDYLSRQVGTVVTHGLCPTCAARFAEEGEAAPRRRPPRP